MRYAVDRSASEQLRSNPGDEATGAASRTISVVCNVTDVSGIEPPDLLVGIQGRGKLAERDCVLVGCDRGERAGARKQRCSFAIPGLRTVGLQEPSQSQLILVSNRADAQEPQPTHRPESVISRGLGVFFGAEAVRKVLHADMPRNGRAALVGGVPPQGSWECREVLPRMPRRPARPRHGSGRRASWRGPGS